MIEVNLNLAGTLGGSAGDGAADTVIVNGTNGDDVDPRRRRRQRRRRCSAWRRRSTSPAPKPANDRLTVNALAGDDVVEASGLAAGAIQLTADGGDGNDVLVGGDGNDILSAATATTC